MNHTTFNFKSNDGLTLFSRIWLSTDPSPKAILYLIHGLGEHTGRYAHVADVLNQHGYHLTGFDLRGHGLSEGKRGHTPSYDYLLDDIQLFINECQNRLAGNLSGFLYGHSLGGNLVLSFGLQRSPDLSGFIATSPLIETAFAPPKIKLIAARVLSQIMPTLTMKNGLERPALSRDEAIVEAYESDPYVHDLLSARLGYDMLESGKSILEHAPEWKFPLLLLHGSADRICSAPASEAFAKAAGGTVDLVVRQDGYHELHNDIGKDEVILEIVHWLDRLSTRSD